MLEYSIYPKLVPPLTYYVNVFQRTFILNYVLCHLPMRYSLANFPIQMVAAQSPYTYREDYW